MTLMQMKLKMAKRMATGTVGSAVGTVNPFLGMATAALLETKTGMDLARDLVRQFVAWKNGQKQQSIDYRRLLDNVARSNFKHFDR